MGALDDEELSLLVLKKFRLIFGSVRQHFKQIEENCGVSGSQLWLMQEIGRNPGIGVSDLALRLSIHQSTCSQLIEKLSSRRLVLKKRSKEDQRRVGLELSAAARKLLQKAPGPAEGILPEALQALPTRALKNLDNSLSDVIGQLRERDEKLADRPLADL